MTHLIFRRAGRTAVAATALLLAAPACSVFDTNVTNPNAIEEAALGDPPARRRSPTASTPRSRG